MVRLLNEPEYDQVKIYHYCSTKYDSQANMATLMCAFQIIILNRTAEEAWEKFKPYSGMFVPYRDASAGSCTYNCHIIEVLEGLEFAIKLGWYSFKDFDVQEYEYYEKVENGDLNWIIPGEVLAFMGPSGKSYDKGGHRLHTPEDYTKLFKALDVERVIRLSKPNYDKTVCLFFLTFQRFTRYGFKMDDLYFLDGSTPTLEIVDKFIEIMEKTPGAVGVHCMAGLGRTGALIGCYAMKKYGFPAAAFTGWIRLARPGSILGP